MKITSVEFHNYKAFKHHSVALQGMNVLVGPNNSGKSTIVDAFKILGVALRKARARSPEYLMGPHGRREYGYEIATDVYAVSLENCHTDYSDEDTTITFRISNGNRLLLYFPRDGGCRLLTTTTGRAATSIATFKTSFPISVAVVPVLGRVEHREPLLQKETVQRNLETHLASRHFRNYWYYFPDTFEQFAKLVASTWPGMEVESPELVQDKPPRLSMFCRENRITREIFWAGSGFQIWCQLLTHISAGQGSTLLVIDEPEIYLHPDLQRQLVGILRGIGSDIVLASHSIEIISETDPADILLVDKQKRSAQRLRDAEAVQGALERIGSSQNIMLTRLARNRRVLFVEDDDDIVLLRRMARHLGFEELAAGTEITAVSSRGFSSWEKIEALGWGIPLALGKGLLIGAVYDHDYWCAEEIAEVLSRLRSKIAFAEVHDRKEIENYLLIPSVLCRAISASVKDRTERTGIAQAAPPSEQEVEGLLETITDELLAEIQSQYIARRQEFFKRSQRSLDTATVAQQAIQLITNKWGNVTTRMEIVPGKRVLATFREQVHAKYQVSITDQRIVSAFRATDVPTGLRRLMEGLDQFRQTRADAAQND